MERLDRYLIGLVLANLVVNLVYATAHFGLQILPTGLDLVFIVGVILVGPIAALVILRFNPPLAAGLLAVFMGASFVYDREPLPRSRPGQRHAHRVANLDGLVRRDRLPTRRPRTGRPSGRRDRVLGGG